VRVGEHEVDILTRFRGSNAAVVELHELELGRQDSQRMAWATPVAIPLPISPARAARPSKTHRAAATRMARSKRMGAPEDESPVTGLATLIGLQIEGNGGTNARDAKRIGWCQAKNVRSGQA
jgi:hypothetical protein